MTTNTITTAAGTATWTPAPIDESLITSASTSVDNFLQCDWTKAITTSATLATAIANVTKKEREVSPETKTKLVVENAQIYAKYYNDGYFDSKKSIMSDIVDIEVFPRAIIVKFADGTKTKAILDKDDYFCLEQGISVCITKKLLGKEGTSIYNKLIEKALSVVAKKKAAEAKAHEEKEAAKKRKAKQNADLKKKKERRREEAIAIQAEAYIRALKTIAVEGKE